MVREKLNWKTAVAHINHGLRGRIDEDEQYVRRIASDLNLPFS